MMKFKKFLAAAMTGAMMFGMVATAAPATNTYAAESSDTDTTEKTDTDTKGEAENTPSQPTVTGGAISVKIDYKNYTAELESTSGDTYAFLQVWKMKKDTGDFDKASTTYSCELKEGKAIVDLSFLKATTAQGIKVYGDKDPKSLTEVKITAQPAKLSLKYAAGKFSGKIGKTEIGESNFILTDYEYRGQYGSTWAGLDTLDTVNHQSAGSTIIVRAKATDTSPAGPEAKVKIAAAAKAPKVTIDYVKGEVSFAKNTEYCIAGRKFAGIENLKPKVGDLRKPFNNDGTTDLVLFVRTKEDTSKKKPASNVTCVVIPSTKVITNTASTTTTGGAITVAGDDGSKINVTYEQTTAVKSKQTVYSYKFSVNGASFDWQMKGDTKFKTVKDGKSFVVTQTTSEQTVVIRKSGVKDRDETKSSLPSAEIEIKVPAAPAN